MTTFKICLFHLKKIYHKFDEQSNAQKLELLRRVETVKLPFTNSLLDYHNILLFLCAHPFDHQTLDLAELELKRLSFTLKNVTSLQREKLNNSGLPHTAVVSTFSHDLLKWMQKGNYKIEMDSFAGEKDQLNNVLNFTLPPLEKEITTLELHGNKLFDKLKVKKEDRLPFLLSEFDRLESQLFIKDQLFNSLGMYVNIRSTDQKLSKAYNRIGIEKIYYQKEIIKNFDHLQLFSTKLPSPKKLSDEGIAVLNTAVKNALIVLQRETDPVTYIDERSIRLYELERGISVAIYGMKPERQLPLESYVGYTLFKNGFPAAYGGGWVFGKRSLFGINIFESMRGGESGYILCQLLRVYRQAFGIDYFEVEPYQYGKGNPEGIRSGAFWFYYRYGFKPVDVSLNVIAMEESEKIAFSKGYRTSEETLRKFTKSNLVLNFKSSAPVSLWEIREKVSSLVANEYNGNRAEAERVCVKKFIKKTGSKGILDAHEKSVLVDVSLWAEALKINAVSKLSLLKELIKLKPVNLYEYQKILLKVLS